MLPSDDTKMNPSATASRSDCLQFHWHKNKFLKGSGMPALIALVVWISPSTLQVARGDAGRAPAEGSQSDEVQLFGNFIVLGETQTGKALFIRLPDAQNLESAMTRTADELSTLFGGKPSLSGAFADAQSKSKGVVSLTANLNGRDVHGLIFCGWDKSGGTASIVFAAANAPKQELTTLLGFMPAPSTKMTTHEFPDKSGSIDLPDGWTTPDQTAAHGIGVRGPEGQLVTWHGTLLMSDPECATIRTTRQTYQIQLLNYQRQMQMYQQAVDWHQRNPQIPLGRPPIPPKAPNADPNVEFPALNICRYCDGSEEVLKYWYPIREAKGQRTGRGYASVEKIIAVFPSDPNPYIPGSKSGIAYLAFADHSPDGTIKHSRAVQRLETAPVTKGEAWQLCTSNMRAPDEIFDRDLPVMQTILNSVNLNMNVVTQVQQRNGEAIRKIYADKFQILMKAGRDFQDQQAINFANHERRIAAQAKARHDSNSDFIEYISGVRRVYDHATGKMIDVSLFNSTDIVSGLNEAANDPNRFIQIPLRYLR